MTLSAALAGVATREKYLALEERAWRYDVKGVTGKVVPVLFLDTDLETNAEADRRLSYYLYGGDQHYRLAQEAILGLGGVRMLRALGYEDLSRYHMNEGHSAFQGLERIRRTMKRHGVGFHEARLATAAGNAITLASTGSMTVARHDHAAILMSRWIFPPIISARSSLVIRVSAILVSCA